MNAKRIADYSVSLGVNLGGVDWDATAWYDVISTPRAATLTDPPEGLEIDVVRIVLDSWCGEDGPIAMPPGVWIEPTSLEPDAFYNAEEACEDDWRDCHSPRARQDQAADDARDAMED